MVMTRRIYIRATKEEHEQIRNKSHAKGFHSISAYLRFAGLEQDFELHQKVVSTHQKVTEIYAHLLGDIQTVRFKKNLAAQRRL